MLGNILHYFSAAVMHECIIHIATPSATTPTLCTTFAPTVCKPLPLGDIHLLGGVCWCGIILR